MALTDAADLVLGMGLLEEDGAARSECLPAQSSGVEDRKPACKRPLEIDETC